MKKLFLHFLLFVTLAIAISCNSETQPKNKVLDISADSLALKIDSFENKLISVHGKIIHVCPAGGQKLKLLCPNDQVIKIIPGKNIEKFDPSLNGKNVNIKGIVKKETVSKQYIDCMEKDKTLLCHIDHTPCNDSVWVKSMNDQGYAEEMVVRDIQLLNNKMASDNKDYVTVITVIVNDINDIIVKE